MSVKFSFQSGRSLVELLAVLAVICLLSLGGIELYQKTIISQEGDSIHQDILTTASSFLNKGTNRKGSQGGFGDTQLTYNKTRSGKEMSAVMDCPKNALSIKIAGVKEELCEYLMDKKYPDSLKPMAFYRTENFHDVCSAKVLDSDTTGYYLTKKSDCDKIKTDATFVAVFNYRGQADEIKACQADTDCYRCQTCNTTKQVCEDNCEGDKKCSKETQNCEGICSEGQYLSDDGCQPCPEQTTCDAELGYDVNGCPITYDPCDEDEYCGSDGLCEKNGPPFMRGNIKTYHTDLSDSNCPEGYRWAGLTDISDVDVKMLFTNIELCKTETGTTCDINADAAMSLKDCKKNDGTVTSLCDFNDGAWVVFSTGEVAVRNRNGYLATRKYPLCVKKLNN